MRSRPPVVTRRILFALGLVFAVSIAGPACSSDKSAARDNSTTSSITTQRDEPSPPPTKDEPASIEQFAGSDEDFYVPPKPLPKGDPGDLIRTQKLSDGNGEATFRVMYHTRDAENRDRLATGLVTYPTGEAPSGGWPVVATAPGTSGLTARCGVSHEKSEAPDWGVAGVRVMTDYIGLGPVGDQLQPYLSRPSEGHSVLDSVRAARHLPDAHAGKRWLSVGHSQGGHGALSASELSSEYAPELELLGTVALAPAAMLDRVYGGIDPIVTGVLTAMSLYGGATEHPDIHVDDYVTPELAAASGVFETGCLDEITEALAPLAASGKLFKADPRETEPARSLLLVNDVGDVAVDAPLFLTSGTLDDRVVIDRVRDLFTRLCTSGQATELLIVDGADHGTIVPMTAGKTAKWLQDRLDGKQATNSCKTPPPK